MLRRVKDNPLIEKPATKYVLWRFITVVAISIVITGISVIIWALITKNAFMQTAAFFPVFVCMVTLIAIIQGVFVFSFDYSVLGRLERSLPRNFVTEYQTWSFARVGIVRFGWPLVRWRVGKQGLLITMPLIGTGFIPTESVTYVGQRSWMHHVLEHNWPAIASPVYIPNDVCEAARKICEIHHLQLGEVPSTDNKDR